jgi:pyruvate ferredoxin oxidoreductase alpha subunit
MSGRTGLEASIAIAEAAGLCDVDVIAAYPITPQTHIVEHLSEMVADGRCDAAFVPVESEHSALSVCCGSVATGARTFTATSSQGLALMHEILFIASALRLPIVMAVANRALSAPINIWNDHSDVMAERDVGWIQVFAENGQEAADLIVWAFRVAEDRRVLLPVMVNFDGFILSHVIEPIELPEVARVRRFLPPFAAPIKLDVDAPVSIGPVGIPDIYTEARYAHARALQDAVGPISEAFEALTWEFGRSYHAVETYEAGDADTLLVVMGSIAETAMTVVDERRRRGENVGLVRPRLWRPFPEADFVRALGAAKAVGIIDRAVSPGATAGPVASEVRAALSRVAARPALTEFIVGLGGRDVSAADFHSMFDDLEKPGCEPAAPGTTPRFIGLRE